MSFLVPLSTWSKERQDALISRNETDYFLTSDKPNDGGSCSILKFNKMIPYRDDVIKIPERSDGFKLQEDFINSNRNQINQLAKDVFEKAEKDKKIEGRLLQFRLDFNNLYNYAKTLPENFLESAASALVDSGEQASKSQADKSSDVEDKSSPAEELPKRKPRHRKKTAKQKHLENIEKNTVPSEPVEIRVPEYDKSDIAANLLDECSSAASAMSPKFKKKEFRKADSKEVEKPSSDLFYFVPDEEISEKNTQFCKLTFKNHLFNLNRQLLETSSDLLAHAILTKEINLNHQNPMILK